MKKIMLVNVVEHEETRVAILEDGVLEELYIERFSTGQIAGNIYKGRVANIEPSLQAAFVDFGGEKNGFLHISDIAPACYATKPPKKKPVQIQDVLRRNQEIIVQVAKEGTATKGPALTTYISLPGRYLVMMPHSRHRGISRKVTDPQQRKRLKELLNRMQLPPDMGFIIRTAGADRTKTDLQKDLSYLKRVWNAICKRAEKQKAPALIYRESDLVIRTLRDILSPDISEVIIDSEQAYRRVLDFMDLTMPRFKNRVKLYTGQTPLFHKFGVEPEIEKAQSRSVPLPQGGYIVIDKTEALVAVDVNSGRFKVERNPEETAYKTNLEAAKEIARQLRLRDLGGVIIIDFIDMHDPQHRRDVEKTLSEALRRDRARTKMLRMSAFGIVELTRQRIRPSTTEALYETCPYCKGSGVLKTPESMSLEIMRKLEARISSDNLPGFEILVNPRVADYIQNTKRREIANLEEKFGKIILFKSDERFAMDEFEILPASPEKG